MDATPKEESRKCHEKIDTQESDIHFLGIDSTKPSSNRSFNFGMLEEKSRTSRTAVTQPVNVCLYEVQSKLSYLLNGFSAFIKDFQLSEI
jgi:hypothetical protein